MKTAEPGDIWKIHFTEWGTHPGLVFYAGTLDCWAALITGSDHSERHKSWRVLPGIEGGHELTGLTKPSTLKPDKYANIRNEQLISLHGKADADTLLHVRHWAEKVQAEKNAQQKRT